MVRKTPWTLSKVPSAPIWYSPVCEKRKKRKWRAIRYGRKYRRTPKIPLVPTGLAGNERSVSRAKRRSAETDHRKWSENDPPRLITENDLPKMIWENGGNAWEKMHQKSASKWESCKWPIKLKLQGSKPMKRWLHRLRSARQRLQKDFEYKNTGWTDHIPDKANILLTICDAF